MIIILGLAGFIVMADNWAAAPSCHNRQILRHRPRSRGRSHRGLHASVRVLPTRLRTFGRSFRKTPGDLGKPCIVHHRDDTLRLRTRPFGPDRISSCDRSLCCRGYAGGPALISDLVPMAERQQALATFMGIAFFGQAASMTIGGAIASVSSWRGVFWTYGGAAAAITISGPGVHPPGPVLELGGNPNSEFLKPYGRATARSIESEDLPCDPCRGYPDSRIVLVSGRRGSSLAGVGQSWSRPSDGDIRCWRHRRESRDRPPLSPCATSRPQTSGSCSG